MIEISLRYDLRAPAWGPATATELYAAALDQAAWADALGFDGIHVTSHHGSDDGYCPSPVVFAAAVAGRTQQVRLSPTVIVPFQDPIRLAEDLAVLDVMSRGRVDLHVVAGYVLEEYARFGIDLADRPALVEEGIAALRAAWSGEPFEFRGRTVQVMPLPVQPGGPRITLGGSSAAAAQRAARIADEFRPTVPGLWELYAEACADAGREPGRRAPTRNPGFLHLAEDPDRAWSVIAPHALHETNSYAAWLTAAGVTAGFTSATDADELRARGSYRVVTPEECLALAADVEWLEFHPLMGGLPPELAWESLHLFETAVLPALRTSA